MFCWTCPIEQGVLRFAARLLRRLAFGDEQGQMRTSIFTLSDLYAPIAADLTDVQRVFDEELVSQLSFVNALRDTVRSYRGKMLRPSLLLLCGKATGDLSPDHHTLAAVVEMVHMATLVHDDVLDEADMRRRLYHEFTHVIIRYWTGGNVPWWCIDHLGENLL